MPSVGYRLTLFPTKVQWKGAVVDERIIKTQACVDEGAAWLAQNCDRFDHVIALTGPLPLRRHTDGFDRLVSAIVSQQLSVASAASIWKRVQDAGMITPAAIIAASEDDLRDCGLSRQKIRYLRALAVADIDYMALRDTPSDQVIATLTQVSGIGVWTAEIYAMFSLGRADVFAHGDLALQEAARILFDLPKRPTEKEMRTIASQWHPWRAVAARALWAYYKHVKDREGIAQ